MARGSSTVPATWTAADSQEHTRGFQYKRDANDWLKQVTRRGLDIAPAVAGKWTVAEQFSQWIRKADIAERRVRHGGTRGMHTYEKSGDMCK